MNYFKVVVNPVTINCRNITALKKVIFLFTGGIFIQSDFLFTCFVMLQW